MDPFKSIRNPVKIFGTIDSFNLKNELIERKALKLLTTYNFPESFINYCDIELKCNKNSFYIYVKFPIHSFQNNSYTFYYNENSEFPIIDALRSDEILHNGDLDFRGKMIKYSSFNDNENKVALSNIPENKVVLVVNVFSGTYSSSGCRRITDRRGNKEIYGIMKRVNYAKVFIRPPNLTLGIVKDLVVKNRNHQFYYSNMLVSYLCPKMQKCYEILVMNNFDFKYFDSNGNRCYCSQCFPNNWIDSQIIAGETYIIPRGWTRFGLKIPIILSQQNDIWNTWCNVFHGTNPSAAKSVIAHRTLLINKDIKSDGIRIGKKCSAEEWNNYYVSPHICYSSHPWYSNITDIEPRRGKKRYAQVVLACKIRRGIYQKQAETEGGLMKIFDDYSIINENEIEWFSAKRGCIVPYGVLVRQFGETKRKEIRRLA